MRKIILVTYEEFPSYIGLSTRVKGLAVALKAEGWDVSIAAPCYSLDQRNIEVYEGISIHQIAMPNILKTIKIPILSRLCFTFFFTFCIIKYFWGKEFKFDYIQSEQIYPFWGSFILAKRKRAKLIFDDPSVLGHFVREKVGLRILGKLLGCICDCGEALVSKLPDYIICSSQRMTDYFTKISRGDKSMVFCVPNGITKEKLIAFDQRELGNKVFFNCSLPYYQNLAALRNILNIVRYFDDVNFTDYKLSLVLNNSSLLPEEFRDFFIKRKQVSVLSKVPDLGLVMAGADFIVLPFERGHFSTGGVRLKALEGLASGRLVLSTSEGVDGIHGLEHNKNFILCSDWLEMANKLRHLILDKEGTLKEAQRMAGNARDLTKNYYTWDKLVEAYKVLT